MKWREISLKSRQPLMLRQQLVAVIERRDDRGINNSLWMKFSAGAEMVLPSAVDVGEMRDEPRVFLFEAAPADLMMLFGGEKAYWIRGDGNLVSECVIGRETDLLEYWATEFVNVGAELIVIYETGVFRLNSVLRFRWHKAKMINDFFISAEDGYIRFARDHDTEWTMQMSDGASSIDTHWATSVPK